MNTLRLTNEQAWRLSQLLDEHSCCISKEHGSKADDYGPILQQLYKDIPKVKEFEDEFNDIITDKDKPVEDVQDWDDRLQSWFRESDSDKLNACSQCGDYAVVEQTTRIRCFKCEDNTVTAPSYTEAVSKWNAQNKGSVFVLKFISNRTPNIKHP